MSVFGFSTESSGGDFTPIVKYDARFGTFTRVDRTQNSDGTWEASPVDITREFKALVDFENIEVGWIDFATGGAPSFVLVPRGEQFPRRPNENHKQGVRIMIKLAPSIGGDKPIRELASTAKSFLSGLEQVVEEYLRLKDQHPGKLPQLALNGLPGKIKSGSGARSTETYRPDFRIIGWSPRGDLVFTPKSVLAGKGMATAGNGHAAGNGQTPPNTGSTRAEAPNPAARAAPPPRPSTVEYDPNDFG